MNINQLISGLIDDKNDNYIEVDKLLNDINIRKRIYSEIHKNLLPIHRKVVLKLIQIEIQQREEDLYEDYEMFYWCIFLLSRFEEPSDVGLIWKAKNIDFDDSLGVEPQFLIGSGFEKTARYLEFKNDEESREILNYLEECKVKGDFENIEGWYSYRVEYFNNFITGM